MIDPLPICVIDASASPAKIGPFASSMVDCPPPLQQVFTLNTDDRIVNVANWIDFQLDI
jgi:hypothetical protein